MWLITTRSLEDAPEPAPSISADASAGDHGASASLDLESIGRLVRRRAIEAVLAHLAALAALSEAEFADDGHEQSQT